MSAAVESLFTSALGLQAPWVVRKVKLDTSRRRIDFELDCTAKRAACPHCHAPAQGIHDRLERQWRHLDFFQFEAWLHAKVPRIACTACGKTSQMAVPWAREGSGFTALFEALALSLCQSMPVRLAAQMLRCTDKQLWRRVSHYVQEVRAKEDMSGVTLVGIDETSLRKGQSYITVVHDLKGKRLLFACEGREHKTVQDFAADFKAHGGAPDKIEHVCMDMSAAYTKGVSECLPGAQISYDRFHVVALANKAMDGVRREEVKDQPKAVEEVFGDKKSKLRKSLAWAMRRNPCDWSAGHAGRVYLLQRSRLKSACAWRLKMALREVYAKAALSNDQSAAKDNLKAWINWARRSRLAPFIKLAKTLGERLGAVMRGMVDKRSNAYVEAMNGLLQQVKRAARGFRTAANFIAIAYLRMSKLKHLPGNPFEPAAAQAPGLIHRCA